MLPTFLVSEATVREAGESPVLQLGDGSRSLHMTLGITHAVEHEIIEIDIHGSDDGLEWFPKPLASIPAKSYCGTYDASVPPAGAKYLKACWRVKRWARGGQRPFFRFYVFLEEARALARTA